MEYNSKIDPLPTRYGGRTNVTILPGVGIGPEIMECTLEVLKASEAPLSFEILTISSEEDEAEEFENILTSIRRNKVCLKGNIEIRNKNPLIASRNILLRKNLDLYVYIIYCKTYKGLENKFGDIDITVIRQNTEGEYLMHEHEPRKGTVESLKVMTQFNLERLVEFAFKFMVENKKKVMTLVHSADVQVNTEGMFVDAAKTISKRYPEVQMNVVEVGVAVISILRDPSRFDVLLATNLNGSIVSNIISGMAGGPGLSYGINYSSDGLAVFEPGARNKGSSIVKLGIANPVSMIMAGIKLLEHLGYHKTAKNIQKSVFTTLVYDKVRTKDLGGKATTEEITQNVIRHIRQELKPKTQKIDRSLVHSRWKTYCQVPEKKPK